MNGIFIVAVCTAVYASTVVNGQLRGILINGQTCTQFYDPFGEPHNGTLTLSLQKGDNALYSSAVISSDKLAYFASGGGEMCNKYS
jgi:hypothetical protein